MEHPTHKGLFVSDGRRLVLRIVQTLAIATVAYLVPNFGDIVSLDILSYDLSFITQWNKKKCWLGFLHSTWRLSLYGD